MVNQPVGNHGLLQGQMRIAKLKSAYNSLVIGRTGVKRGYPNLKVLITHLLLVVQVWDGKPTNRKSWAENLFVWSYLTLSPSFMV